MNMCGCASHVHMYALASHLLSASSPSYSLDLQTSLYSEEQHSFCQQLATARKLIASQEILLWMTPLETPKALQASECSELLDRMRASCWISAQHYPGKFEEIAKTSNHRPQNNSATNDMC